MYIQAGLHHCCLHMQKACFLMTWIILLLIDCFAGYEIEVKTSGKQEAGTIHNGWIILESKRDASKVFKLENSAANKILRK